MMSRQYSFGNNEVDPGVPDDFTLKLSSSESDSDDDLRLEISSDGGDINSGYCNSSKEDEYQSSTIQVVDNRPLSPVFNFKIFKSNAVSCQSLDYDLQLTYNKVEAYLKQQSFSNSVATNEENLSSSESELELNTFKKIGNKTNSQLFSPDSGSILSEEESLMDISKNSDSAFKESDKLERRITRSDALKRKKLLQEQTLAILKERRSQKIKILMPFVSACVISGTTSKKSLKQKLREMKLFRIL